MGIKHVFFDLDNTLWDHRKNAKLTLQKLFITYDVENQYGINFNEFHEVYHTINENLWADLRDQKIDKEFLRKHRFYDAFLYFNIDNFALSQTFEHQFLDEIIQYNELIPGAIEILDYLESKKYRLHIITNGFKEVTFRKIEGSGIQKYFSTITSADDVGVRKPQPAIFNHALKITNATKTESILIGDDWVADVEGALNYGLDVIFFNGLEENVEQIEIKVVKYLKDIIKFL